MMGVMHLVVLLVIDDKGLYGNPFWPRLAISVRYCPPHGGGDPSLMWNIDHAEHGSPPTRGGQLNGAY